MAKSIVNAKGKAVSYQLSAISNGPAATSGGGVVSGGSNAASGVQSGGGGGGGETGGVRLEANAAVQVVEDAGHPGTLLVAFAQDGRRLAQEGRVGLAPDVRVAFAQGGRAGVAPGVGVARRVGFAAEVMLGEMRFVAPKRTGLLRQISLPRMDPTQTYRLDGGTRADGSQGAARTEVAQGGTEARASYAQGATEARAEDVLPHIVQLLKCCVTAAEEDYFLLAAFALNTWVNDYLDFAPYIVVQGAPQTGKSTVLRLMSLICRHGLLAADIAMRGLLNACSGYNATVLIDDYDEMDSPTLRRLLRAGTLRHMFTLRSPVVGTAYGPKIIATTEPMSDPALSSRCVRIAMHESRNRTLLDPFEPEIMILTDKLRTLLTRFRLAHALEAVTRPVAGEERLRARAREVLRSLAAPFSTKEPGEKLQYYLEHYFTWEERQLTAIQTMALPTLFEMAHRNDHDGSVTVAEFGRTLRAEARELGHEFTFSPRKLGWELRGLGLQPRRGNEGYVIDLYGENVKALHEMTQRYKSELPPAVPFPGNPEFEAFRTCASCREYRLIHEGLLGALGAPSSQ